MKPIRCWLAAKTVAAQPGEHFGVEDRIPLVYGTFSKAFGALGGFGWPERTIEYCVFTRILTFFCSFAARRCRRNSKAARRSVQVANCGPNFGRTRNTTIRNIALSASIPEHRRRVIPIVIGDRERMYRLCHELRRRGLWVAPVDYPAVPLNRVAFPCVHVTAKHTRPISTRRSIFSNTLVPAALQNA